MAIGLDQARRVVARSCMILGRGPGGVPGTSSRCRGERFAANYMNSTWRYYDRLVGD